MLHQRVPSNISLVIYFLVLMFGTGSWVVMNGIWVELPNLVNETPEGWKLASYLTIICQLANIGPLLYSIVKKRVHNKTLFERRTIKFIFILGGLACILLSFLWNKTVVLSCHNYSVWLMVLIFLISLVDCTSSVTFLPFMVTLPPVYMSPFYIGESISGFVPSLIALAQGIDIPGTVNITKHNITILAPSKSTLRFPQMGFFLILAMLVFISFIAFLILTVKFNNNQKNENLIPSEATHTQESQSDEQTLLVSSEEDEISSSVIFSYSNIIILIAWSFWLSFLQNGLLSAISSYAYAPYGTLTYHLASNLGTISSGFFSFIYLWLPNTSPKYVSLYAILYTLCSSYVLAMAIMSPSPLMYDQTIGRIVIVLVSIISCGLIAYTKVSIASIMRLQNSAQMLFYIGVAYQLGSFIGAILGYVFVNYTNIFND